MSKKIIYNDKYFWEDAQKAVKALPDEYLDFSNGSITDINYTIQKDGSFSMSGRTLLNDEKLIDKVFSIIAPDDIIDIEIKRKKSQFILKAEWLY